MDKNTILYPTCEKTYSSPADFDKSHILAGLALLGIDESYKIAIYNTDNVVVNTASEVLTRFFAKAGINIATEKVTSVGEKQILLILNDTSDEQKALFEKNKIITLDYDKKDDVSHIVKDGSNIIIAGSNGRGVLFGVYEFEEFVMYSGSDELNITKTWDFRTRGQSLGFYWNDYENFQNTVVNDARIEYLSRLGTNLFFPCFDGSGYRTLFMEVVKSDIFPWQDDPNEEFIKKLDYLIPLLAKYGIDYYHWFTEPGIPRMMGGDLSKYSPEMLGHTVNWEGDLTTFCINNKTVQDYYSEMVVKFIRRFPDCKGFILYNLDCGAWFCNTAECENCKKVVSEESLGRSDAWENISKMVSVLYDAAQSENPKFNVVFWPNIHHSGKELDYLLENSRYSALWGCWTGTDHDVIITKKAKLTPNTLAVLKASKEKDIPYFAGAIINRSECIPQGFAYPFSVIKHVKQLNAWDLTCQIESTGPNPTCNPLSAIAMKDYLCNASLDTESYVRELMSAQFGSEAGELMYKCMEKTEEAMQSWDEYEVFSHPMGGSKSFLNISDILNYPLPLEKNTLDLSKKYGMYPLPAGYIDDFNNMAMRLAEAADFANQAIEKASDSQYIRYAYYEDDVTGIVRPSCKDYAVLNCATTTFGALVAKQRVNLFKFLDALDAVEKAEAAGEDTSVLCKVRDDILRADISIQEEVLAFYRYHLNNKTYFNRASFNDVHLNSLINRTVAKIGVLKAALGE